MTVAMLYVKLLLMFCVELACCCILHDYEQLVEPHVTSHSAEFKLKRFVCPELLTCVGLSCFNVLALRCKANSSSPAVVAK